MYIIPIKRETLELITELNNGVQPELSSINTFFVWYKDKPADIWTETQVQEYGGWEYVNLLYSRIH